MDGKPKITRRGFVAASALAGAAAETLGAQQAEFFSADNAKLAAALADTIIPPDDEWPGGAEAGVVSYLEKQLRGPLSRFAPLYLIGLPALDATALRLAGKSFPDLSPDERTALLQQFEKGEAEGPEWPDFSAQTFLARAVEHAMQGFYGAPHHGGNRGGVSWRMLGIMDVMH
ncbi:MAG: twin-arginine translocation signal domain-containing protein [Acidobacteria bacterium]|nr:twin-arginine translocation signal domain-containing protein [Acidobacteriota bacterium]